MREFNLDKIKATGTTVGDLYFPQTKLLLPFDGANGATTTSDLSDTNATVTFNGNSQISTAQSKFGGSSLYVSNSNPTGVYTTGAGSTIQLTGDFTFEWWFYRVQATMAGNMVVGPIYGATTTSGNTSANARGLLLGYYHSSLSTSQSAIYAASDGASSWNMANGTLLGVGTLGTVGQWVHMVMVRSGSDWSYYIDGTRTYNGSLGSSTIAAPGGYILLGNGWSGVNNAEGYYDDFRITQGQARYTGASFTVPTTAHLTSAGDVNKQILVNEAADGVAIGTGGINQARIAKVWCGIDMSTASINDSYSVSSITDNGAGDFTITFTTAMSSADYSWAGGAGESTSTSDNWFGVRTLNTGTDKNTSSVRIACILCTATAVSKRDYHDVNIIVFGN